MINTPKSVLLFAYGTLMRNFPLHKSWMTSSKFLTEDSIPGYTLLSLGPYPAMLKVDSVAAQEFSVHGEVYEMPYKDFDKLAEMEANVGYETTKLTTTGGLVVYAFVLDEINGGEARWIDAPLKKGNKLIPRGFVNTTVLNR